MYHSITFVKVISNNEEEIKNTWDDWHLIPSSEPMFSHPNAVYSYVDVPGADGSLDLTDYLIGRPTYSDRQGTFEFVITNGYDPMESRDFISKKELRTQLANYFNGGIMAAYLEDDPDYFYVGRFFFKGRTPDASHSKVTIEYRVRPYRYSIDDGEEAGL